MSDLDRFRKRVYAADVTEEDRERYRAALAAADHPAPVPADVPARTSAVVGPGARRAAVAVTLGTAAAAILLVAVLAPAIRPAPQAPDPLRVAPTTRAAFARAVDQGRPDVIARWFYEHPERLPPAIRALNRADTTEYHGTGPRAVRLDPSALAQAGGRTTVVLVTADPTRAAWRLTRGTADRTSAERAGPQREGLPTTATVAYEGRAPTRLHLDLDDEVAWALAVILSD